MCRELLQSSTVSRKEIHGYCYYIALLVLTSFLFTGQSEPSILIRFFFLLALFVPLYVWHHYLLPACIIAFSSIGMYSFGFSFMPYGVHIYPILLLPTILYAYKSNVNLFFILMIFMVILIVDVLDSGSLSNLSYSLITVFFLLFVSDYKNNVFVYTLLISFTIASVLLSIIYIINYNRFLTVYNTYDNMSRSGWTDPNYFSSLLCLGIVTSIITLYKIKIRPIRIFAIASAATCFITQLLLASRGGLLATVVTVLTLHLFSKMSLILRLSIILLVAAFFLYLSYEGVFDLIIYRLENDSGGGSGRLEIWQGKFDQFCETANFYQWLFGFGNRGAFFLEINGGPFGFHNDYLALFCAYGIFGIICFLFILLYPLYIAARKDRLIIFSLICPLALICTTLEPIYSGNLIFLLYMYFIYIFSFNSKMQII